MKNKQNFLKAIRFLTLVVVFVSMGTFAFAQQRTIAGKIVDSENVPLPGVAVMVKGASSGTITNLEGIYTISGVSNQSVLVFSFIGMVTQEIVVGSQSTINVTMQTDALGLDEVIVVGYGAQKKATMTGAVTQVKGDQIMKSKGTSSAALALQGEVAGVVVTRTAGRPGNEGIDIKIRGDISVNGVDPLILLDGLEINTTQMATINSNDIENISVLKDGSAAIYGTKAAGGVILITTKQGKSGALKVEYKGDAQFNFADDYPIASFKELADLWLLGGRNDMVEYVDETGATKTGPFTGRFFTQDEWQMISDQTLPLAPESYAWNGNETYFADNNYYDEIFGTTLSQRHNLSLSGGNDKTTYRTSLGYADERSSMQHAYDGAKKLNFRTNVNYEVSDVVKTDFSVSFDHRLTDEPSQGVGEGLQNPAFYPTYNPYGQYYAPWGNNIPAKLAEGGRTKTTLDAFRLQGGITFDLDKYIRGFSVLYRGNVSLTRIDNTDRINTVTWYDWEGNFAEESPTMPNTSVNVNLQKNNFQNHNIQANYRHSFGNHNLGLMAGSTWEEYDGIQYNMYRKGMLSEQLDDLNTGDPASMTNGGTSTTKYRNSGTNSESLISYISRVNYDYNGIYLVEALVRRDGTSRFAEGYKYANFFNASAGIRLSEMDFLKDGFFDNLKIRASYGETGSKSGIGMYDYISTITTGQTYFGTSPSIYSTAYVSSLTTTERTWERIENSNIGLDFAILNSRLSGTVELFHRQNNDMLIGITYPEILGIAAPETNSGDFNTNGFEVSLNWRDKVGALKYNIGISTWDSRSEVTRMEGATDIDYGVNYASSNEIIEGKPLNAIYVFETDGIMQTEAEVLEYYNKYGFVDPADHNVMKPNNFVPAYNSVNRLVPGTVARKDANDDGVINKDDLVYFGDANPHYSFGINLGLEWKGFDFYSFLQGVGQQYTIRTGTLGYPFRAWWMNQNPYFVTDTWTPENTGADLPAVFYNGTRKNWNYAQPNDINVMKTRYLRAKVITLGYTLPKDITMKAGIERLRISATGNDLFTISNVKDGLDPEAGSNQHNGDAYPYFSNLIFSLELTF